MNFFYRLFRWRRKAPKAPQRAQASGGLHKFRHIESGSVGVVFDYNPTSSRGYNLARLIARGEVVEIDLDGTEPRSLADRGSKSYPCSVERLPGFWTSRFGDWGWHD